MFLRLIVLFQLFPSKMSKQESRNNLDIRDLPSRSVSPFEGPVIIPPLQRRETEAVLKVFKSVDGFYWRQRFFGNSVLNKLFWNRSWFKFLQYKGKNC